MEYNYCPDCGADMREKEKTDAKHCVFCDAIIPEGIMVCPVCEGKYQKLKRIDEYRETFDRAMEGEKPMSNKDNFIVTNGPTYLGSFERLEYALIFIQEYLEKYYNECEVTIHRNLKICEKNEKLNRGS